MGSTGQFGDYLLLGCGRPFWFFTKQRPFKEDILSLLKNGVVAKFSTTKSKPLLVHRRELKTEKQNFPKGHLGESKKLSRPPPQRMRRERRKRPLPAFNES